MHFSAYSFVAGWSSPVAREAHTLKVTGSNPVPATTSLEQPPDRRGAAFNKNALPWRNVSAPIIRPWPPHSAPMANGVSGSEVGHFYSRSRHCSEGPSSLIDRPQRRPDFAHIVCPLKLRHPVNGYFGWYSPLCLFATRSALARSADSRLLLAWWHSTHSSQPSAAVSRLRSLQGVADFVHSGTL